MLFCEHYNQDWIFGKVCNPLVDVIVIDIGLVDAFDNICYRICSFLVVNSSKDVEEELLAAIC